MTDVEDSNFSSRFKGRERPPPLMAPPANVSIQPSGQHSPLSPAAFFLPSVLLPLSSPTPSSPMTPSALLAQQMYAPVSPSHVVSDLWSAATTSPTAVPRSYAEASYSQPPEVLSRQFSQGPKESFSYRQEIQPGYGGLHSDPRYPRQQIAYQSVAAPQHASFFNQQSFQRPQPIPVEMHDRYFQVSPQYSQNPYHGQARYHPPSQQNHMNNMNQRRYRQEDIDASSRLCFRCGSAAHLIANCPYSAESPCPLCQTNDHSAACCKRSEIQRKARMVCYNCGLLGHSRTNCPNPKKAVAGRKRIPYFYSPTGQKILPKSYNVNLSPELVSASPTSSESMSPYPRHLHQSSSVTSLNNRENSFAHTPGTLSLTNLKDALLDDCYN